MLAPLVRQRPALLAASGWPRGPGERLALPSSRRWASSGHPRPGDKTKSRLSNAPAPPRRVAGQRRVGSSPPPPPPEAPEVDDVPPPSSGGVLRSIQSAFEFLWRKATPPELAEQTEQGKVRGVQWDRKSPSEQVPKNLPKLFHPLYKGSYRFFNKMERVRFTMLQALWMSFCISIPGYFCGTLRGQQMAMHTVAEIYGLDISGESPTGYLPGHEPGVNPAPASADDERLH